MIKQHANDCLDKGLDEIKHEVCGVAVDCATFMAKHCCAFILVNPTGLRLATIKKVGKIDAITLYGVIGEILNDCGRRNIIREWSHH